MNSVKLGKYDLLTLVEGDLDTVLCRLQVGNLLLHIIALPVDLRGALQLGDLLQHCNAVHVRHHVTHLDKSQCRNSVDYKHFYLVGNLSRNYYRNLIALLHSDGPATLRSW